MTISKSYLTILTNLFLAIIGSGMAHLTGWLWVIPILFGLGIPLVNIDRPLKQKFGLTSVIVLVSIAVFLIAIMTAMGFQFDKFIFPAIVAGFAGTLIFGINGLLIASIKISFKSVCLTFILSGLSLPIWIYLTENILSLTLQGSDLVRQFGVMIFWMIMTTIGISTGIKEQ